MKHPIMRRLQQLVVTFSLLLLVFAANGQVQTARYISMTPNSNGFYEYLPQGYGSGSQTYPLLLFIHGTGELGDGSPSQLPKVLVNGPPRLINVNQFPASFTVNGVTKSFIVISPQFTAWPSSSDIDNVINYATQHYRVDLNRIYLTGLSMGGGVVWEYAGGSSANANRLAGLFPVCGASYPDLTRGRTMANANLPIWAFHNDQDGTVPVWYTNDYIDYINQAPAPNPIAKKSIFVNASHDAWTKAYDPNYRENNMNVYEYMLQFQRNGAPSNNLTPSVNAGPDQSISASSAQLNASASDPDGSIVSYSWSRLAGPTQFTLSNSSIPNPTLSNLAAGRYTFRVVVTDNQGATAYDDINIVITASIPAKIEAEGYANMSGVQAETTQDVGGGQNVGYIDYNDWMEYNLNVPAAGTYNVNFRISAPTAGAQFQVKDAAGAVLATVIVPNTGGYQTWQTISSSVVLPAGAQVVRLVSTNSTNWNFNWLEFTTGTTTPPPPPPTPGATTRIEAENFTSMFGVNTETTSDAGGGKNVSYIDNGDWMDYSVNMAAAGNYTVNFRVASPGYTGQLQIKKSDGTLLSTLNIPYTGGWQNFQTASTTIPLQAGQQTIRIQSSYATGWNFNWWEVAGASGTPGNTAPIANAGPDQTITLPVAITQLAGTGTDADGSISKYSWSKVSGPSLIFADSTSATTSINSLIAGTYTLRLTVTDNAGATGSDDVVITVNGVSTPSSTTRIEAENYTGMSGVQKEATSDAGGGQDVGYIDNGDWMDYTVTVPTAGNYNMNFRIATPGSTAQLQVKKADGSLLTTIGLPNTGGWQTFQTATASVTLAAGTQTIRIQSSYATGWNFNWMEVVGGTTVPVPPTPGTSQRIEAESYATMSGVQKETTSDAGGGQDVGYIDNGDWMDYSVNVPVTGSYQLNVRVASPGSTGQLQVKKADGSLLGTVNVPNTGGWQTFQTASITVNLTAGQQTIRIQSNYATGWNFNWWELVPATATVTAASTSVSEVAATTNPSIQVFPNPVTDRFMLQINNDYTGQLTVQIIDMTGTVQKQFVQTKQTAGALQTYLSIGSLQAGQYILKATMSDWTDTEKIIKQ